MVLFLPHYWKRQNCSVNDAVNRSTAKGLIHGLLLVKD